MKLFFAVLMILYLIFVVVVYRQITLMGQILKSEVTPLLKTIALAQIVVVGFLFVVGLVLV